MITEAALAHLRSLSSPEARAALARYGIPDDRAIGVPMGAIKRLAKEIGTDHALALALWRTGGYEARTLAAHLADPAAFDLDGMTSWVRDFDNWAICDTTCFQCFRHAGPAWEAVPLWTAATPLYVRRAGAALLWALAGRKGQSDASFVAALPALEAVADDDRDHVAKALDMALRATAKRSPALREEVRLLVARLAAAGPAQARLARQVGRALG